MKVRTKKWLCGILAVSMVTGITACSKGEGETAESKEKEEDTVKLDPENPVYIEIWHYYNGMQQKIFDKLVKNYNETEGLEKGIIVEAHSKGSVTDLADSMTASAEGAVGAEDLPNLFASYADTAYEINKKGLLVDISQYIAKEDLDQYLESYLKEGYLNDDDGLKIFPVAKSTEVLVINKTDWDVFAKETGASDESFKTWEGMAEVAKEYYEWTDAKTPDIEHDGKAFFGRDAFANYMLVGKAQLGTDFFSVGEDGKTNIDLSEDSIKRLWDNFYVPYVYGYYGAYGKFRSDDIKTGQLLAQVGSTSGALYFPDQVTMDNGESYAIESAVYPIPNFEGTKSYAVQQGAGFAVTKSTKEEEYASCEFLKWFTKPENNVEFSISSGYLPVTYEADSMDYLKGKMEEENSSEILKDIIETGVTTTNDYTLYSPIVFEHSDKARKTLEYSMMDAANAAIEKRDSLVESGMDYDEATQSVTDDKTFEEWMASLKKALEEDVK